MSQPRLSSAAGRWLRMFGEQGDAVAEGAVPEAGRRAWRAPTVRKESSHRRRGLPAGAAAGQQRVAFRIGTDSGNSASGNSTLTLHVNVRAPILLIQAMAARHEGGDCLIVNLLDSKLAAPNPDFLSYTLSKQALAGFTEVRPGARSGRNKGQRHRSPALMLKSPGQSDDNFTGPCTGATRWGGE
jgi:hypothetical protein